MTAPPFPAKTLSSRSSHSLLLAIDSDGCVFDSMTIKQRIFQNEIIRLWNLDSFEPEFRRIAEWVGLFSPWRGLNRFELLLRIFESLERYSSVPIPDLAPLCAFVDSGVALSADELARRIDYTGDPELKRVLDWSRSVSAEIAAVQTMPVFEEAPESLKVLREHADLIVVSQTAEEALLREWHQAGLDGLVDLIAGAESGSKTSALRGAMSRGRSASETVMIGDAPGDLEAARQAGCLFFPIRPGAENESWVELRTHGVDRLRSGSFAGPYAQELVRLFHAALQDSPPG